ncbi:hypothetical protein PHYPSEUDO_000541 [Phytophthora pseudosyringae]|uniref:Uncharacterized protein n=1 Tax=Phytophthora pseudosyringae TaxID=221518 RepID=A0A8T1W1Z6_9STRA|nr:hypothetical protein PHYPSEUDO_000541 [Phytophthora pseudosyringae]
MGAKGSKPPPRRIEEEVAAVEVFQDEPPRESNSSHKQHKTVAPAQGGSVHIVGNILQEPLPHTNGSQTGSSKAADAQQTKQEAQTAAKEEKQKKKRRRSKKDKNKPPPPRLVRAQTQLNELKNVKPLLQQSPQARQQHFEHIKDAYALDEDAKKAPPPDVRSRFFSFENWRKAPPTPSGKGESPTAGLSAPRTRSQMTGVPRALFSSSGRSSNGIEDLDGLDDVELLTLPPASRTVAITAPAITTTPCFLAASNPVDYGRPDVQSTPVIRVKTSERRTPERRTPEPSKRSLHSQRSDLRIDDVDEDLMEHILTDDGH